MNYFQILGITFGLLALLKPLYLHMIPWDEYLLLSKAYKQKRPKWILPIAIFGVLLVIFTWYMYFNCNIKYSFIITCLFSLTLLKALTLIFNYSTFQNWIKSMIEMDKSKIVEINFFTSFIGFCLILFSLLMVK